LKPSGELLAAIVVCIVGGELEWQWVVDVIVTFNPEWHFLLNVLQDVVTSKH